MFDKKINIDTDTEKYCNILVRYWYWLSIFLYSVSISILQYISDTDTCYFFLVSAKSLLRAKEISNCCEKFIGIQIYIKTIILLGSLNEKKIHIKIKLKIFMYRERNLDMLQNWKTVQWQKRVTVLSEYHTHRL